MSTFCHFQQTCSTEQLIQHEYQAPVDSILTINGLFPKIDNLEYFPLQVLQQIFTNVDDVALLNLAEVSYRFEGIAKTVFRRRYSKAYFVVDGESDSEQQMYWSLFNCFGDYADIKAIKANGIQDIGGTHWLSHMLKKYAKHLQRLTFDGCTFKNVYEILIQHLGITHLVLENDFHKEIQLPVYRNLMALDLSCSISFGSLKVLIENNPLLESLLLRDCCEIATFRELIFFIVDHLNHLKKLALVNLNHFEWTPPPPREAIDRIVNSLNQLESLALGTGPEIIGLMQRLSFGCHSIKHLEIDQIGENLNDAMLETLCKFKTIESLSLSQPWYDDAIESSLIEFLPKLRHLSFSMSMPNTYSYVLALMRKCLTLEKITIDVKVNRPDWSPTLFVNAEFFAEFRATMGSNRDVRIEFEENSQIIGFVTKTEIVWRKKLMHWIGCDSSCNLSGLNLLDLAEDVDALNTGKRCPFQCILNYLDLNSLRSLSKTSKKSEELVSSYVKRHAQQNGSFIITDEFGFDATDLDLFAEYVENLKVYFFQRIIHVFQQMMKNHFIHLKKVWYFSTYLRSSPMGVCVPQIRHLVFIGSGLHDFCDLHVICRICPHLEQLEFRTKTKIYSSSDELLFYDLKRLVYKCSNDDQAREITDLFEGKDTELVRIK